MSDKKILALHAIRDLLDDTDAWTKGSAFRNKHGHSLAYTVAPESRAQFCILGAVWHVSDQAFEERYDQVQLRKVLVEALCQGAAVPYLGSAHGFQCVQLSTWNDAGKRTHAQVLAAVNRAIEIAAGVVHG